MKVLEGSREVHLARVTRLDCVVVCFVESVRK